jgi:Ser/Thr protein kinase RdoA (MazF antagonist)
MWSWLGRQWYTDTALRAQLHLVDHLRAGGVPFPARHRPAHGDWVDVSSDGVRYRAVAFDWVPRARPARRLSGTVVRGAGAMLARLHQAAVDFPEAAALGEESLVGWSTQVADELAELIDAMPVGVGSLARRHVADIRRRVDQVSPLHPELAGHGDLNRPNVLVRRGRVVSIVDIGRMARVNPVEELANVVRWFSQRRPRVPSGSRARAIVTAYRRVDPSLDPTPLPALGWLSAATSPHLYFAIRRALTGESPVDPDDLARRFHQRRAQADALERISRPLARW